jgi:hypothetical protein
VPKSLLVWSWSRGKGAYDRNPVILEQVYHKAAKAQGAGAY